MKKLIAIAIITFVITGLSAKAQEIQIWKSGMENIENSICQEPKPGNINFTVEETKDETPIRKYIIYAQNLSSELGVRYNWQFFSTKDSKWKDVPNEYLTKIIITNDTKNHSTYYRFKTTCRKSGLSNYSNKVLIL